MDQIVLCSTDGKYHGHTTFEALPTLKIIHESTAEQKAFLRTVTVQEWDEIAANSAHRVPLINEYGKKLS